MPNTGPSTNNSLSSLTAKINAQAEAERQALESQVETEFKTLCANLRKSAENAFSTIESDIQTVAETARGKTAAQLRLLNNGFMKRCLLCALASLTLLSVVTMTGWATVTLARHYINSLRRDLNDLDRQKAALEETLEQLEGKTWGLKLIETKEGRFIVPPPKAKLKTGWTIDARPAIKLE